MVSILFKSSVLPGRSNVGLVVLCLAEAMVLLDTTVMNVALPTIRRDLHISLNGLQWVMTAYVLPLGGLLLLCGRLGDLWGRRRLFTTGLVLFSVSSLLGGVAPGPAFLLAARTAQGVGAACLAPTALALVSDLFPPGSSRDRALGVFSAVAALGFTVGAIAGGVLTELAGWRWVLLVNLPLGIVGVALAGSLPPAVGRRAV